MLQFDAATLRLVGNDCACSSVLFRPQVLFKNALSQLQKQSITCATLEFVLGENKRTHILGNRRLDLIDLFFLLTARWGSWTEWSPCMKTCGTGVSLRSRKCLTGANCRGTGTETKKCKIQDCPCKPLLQL